MMSYELYEVHDEYMGGLEYAARRRGLSARDESRPTEDDLARLVVSEEMFSEFADSAITALEEASALGVLKSGIESFVASLDQDGQELVVRLARDRRPMATHGRAVRLARGFALFGVEQLVAHDYENGLVISTRMPGVYVGELDAVVLAAIRDDHYEQSVASALAFGCRGLTTDYVGDNRLYCQENGFGEVNLRYDLISPRHSALEGLLNSFNYRRFAGDANVSSGESQETIKTIAEGFTGAVLAALPESQLSSEGLKAVANALNGVRGRAKLERVSGDDFLKIYRPPDWDVS